MAALHSVQAQKEASGKVEGCGAPVEAAPARRSLRLSSFEGGGYGAGNTDAAPTASRSSACSLRRPGSSAAASNDRRARCGPRSVPVAEAPLHSGIARLDAKARQQGAALRDPGAPPNLTQPPSGCAFHPRCAHAMPQCVTRDPDCQEVGPKLTAKCWLLDKQPQEEYASAIA